MRFPFITEYRDDLRLLRYRSDWWSYGALLAVLLVLPAVLGRFYLGEVAFIFVLAIAAVGLMTLTGFTGLVSLGHGAFLGVGAYAHALLMANGVPFVVALPAAGVATAAIGVAVGFPTLRLSGLYLAIATLAFSVIVEHVLGHWRSLTGGFLGLTVQRPDLFGWSLAGRTDFYYLCLAVLAGVVLAARNLLRSETGRAFIALRDSETAAAAFGVNVAWYKTLAFAVSAGVTGIAGGLYAHKLGHITPEAFGLFTSLELVLMVVVGGLGSLRGAVLGAIFVGALPQVIAFFRDVLPKGFLPTTGLELTLYGGILVLFLLFEPDGLNGRWLKIKALFQTFPLYRRRTFQRTKTYMRSERYR